MALPTLTDEQRAASLAKAAEARKVRGELLAAVKAGTLDVATVLGRADSDEIVRKMRVSALLKALPGVGAVKAAKMLEELSIAGNRRLGGLGDNQRQALIKATNISV